MAQAETIREFLVSVGFDVKKDQEKRFNDWMANATKTVMALGAALASYKIASEFNKISDSFERFYYLSQRSGASVGGIKAFTHAVEQLGGSAEGAQSALENFGRQMRENPNGIANYLKSLGVNAKDANGNLRDSRDILVDVGKALRETYKQNPFVARKKAELLGIDERTFQAIINPNFDKMARQQDTILKRMGIDPEKMAEQSVKVEQIMRTIGAQFEAVAVKVAMVFGPTIEKVLEKFSAWFDAHSDDIAVALEKVGNLFFELAKKVWKFIEPWASDDRALHKLEEWWDRFSNRLSDILGKMVKIINAGAAVASWFGIGGAQAATSFDGNGAGGAGGVGMGAAGGGGGGGGSATGEARKEAMDAAMAQLRKEGVPEANVRAAAALLVGQADMESGLDPNKSHDGGTGYGIYGARLVRRQKMIAWLQQNGYAYNSREGQMRYMAHEAMTDGSYPKTREALMGANESNLAAGSRTLTAEFERPLINNDRSGATRQAFDSLSAQVSKGVTSGIVDLGRELESRGFRISEHPAFGGVSPVHHGRGHYEGRAIDINIGKGNNEFNDPNMRARMDALDAELKQRGYTSIWRQKGHFNHLHAEIPRGAPIGVNHAALAGKKDAGTTINAPQTVTIQGVSDPQEAVRHLRVNSSLMTNRIARDLQGAAQ